MNSRGSQERAAEPRFDSHLQEFLHKLYPVVIILAAIYAVVWSFISTKEFYSLNMYVYDLGIVLERSWIIFHFNWTLSSVLHELLLSGIVFIISPFFTIGGYIFILFFQSFFLGFTIIPLYYISLQFIKSRLPSLLISSSFLIYFPLAGVNWYDAHYQAIFIPLFITGYALYLRGNVKTSIAFLFLSGITRYPYVIFPLLLSIWISLESGLKLWKDGQGKHKVFLSYSFLAIGLTLQLLLSYALLNGSAGVASDIHLQTDNGFASNLFALFDDKILTVILSLVPVLGLTLLSKKWTLFLLPSFALILLSNNVVYVYPITFLKQYASGIAPFIFLGAIEAVGSLTKNEDEPGTSSTIRNLTWRKQVKLTATVLIITALLGTVFLPYGPFNDHTVINYELNNNLNPNMETYGELNHLVSLIPKNASGVVIQNNIPQLLPREPYMGQLLVPGISILYNMTFLASDGNYHKVNPQYILSYPQGNWYRNVAPYPYNISMEQIMSNLYSSYSYGILGEASNMLLLERNYTGPIQYYVPYNTSISGNSFSVSSGVYHSGSTITTHPNLVDQLGWYGPYTSLAPGVYSLQAHLSTDLVKFSDRLTISTTSNYGANNIGSITINGSEFSSPSNVITVNSTIIVKSFEQQVEFKGWITKWSGTLSFYGISIKQLSNVPAIGLTSHIANIVPSNTSILTQTSLAPLFSSDIVSTPVTNSANNVPDFIFGSSQLPNFFPGSGTDLSSYINDALDTKSYGIVAEGNNTILLEKGYAGKPLIFHPFNITYPASSFYVGSAFAKTDQVLELTNSTVPVFWYGPYTTLLPGNYNLTFNLETTNLSIKNNITLDLTYNSGADLIKSTEINGSVFSSTTSLKEVTITFTVFHVLQNVEFRGVQAHWSGTLKMYGANLTQSSA